MFFVFLVQFVDFVATLLQAFNLIQRDVLSHTGFPVTDVKEFFIADAVFRILYDDVHFGSFRHEVSGQAERDVVGVFVFV